MSKIKIFSLGGLDEVGKNTYVIEVDNDIFIFDCGLKYANDNLYGIDYIIPDYKYLIDNQSRIKGLFITHGHDENMGGVVDLIKDIPNIKIFASKYAKNKLLEMNINSSNIIEIMAHRKIVFKKNSVYPISVSHSTPESLMYILNTDDGAIAYTGDFIIDPSMMGHYGMDIGKIAYVGKQGVLALLSESMYSEKKGYTSPKHRLNAFFKDIINRNSDKRIIFMVLNNHLHTIQDIFDAMGNNHRKVVVMGKKLQNIISFSKENNYLSFNDGLLGDLSNLDDKNVVVLLGDERSKPYAGIEKIVNGYDKYISLNTTDVVVFSEPKYDFCEKQVVKIENELAMMGVDAINLPKDKIISLHASREDLMLMIKLLNPKYYIPVRGEYRYMVGNADIALELGINKDNILLKQNGDVINIENGELVDNFEHIDVNDSLMDSKANDDVAEVVIKDRQVLSENGIVLISATLDKKTKSIISGPEVTTKGFIYVKDSEEMIQEIKGKVKEIIDHNVGKSYIDYNNVKQEIRQVLGKYFYEETECKPMVIVTMQEL